MPCRTMGGYPGVCTQVPVFISKFSFNVEQSILGWGEDKHGHRFCTLWAVKEYLSLDNPALYKKRSQIRFSYLSKLIEHARHEPKAGWMAQGLFVLRVVRRIERMLCVNYTNGSGDLRNTSTSHFRRFAITSS